MDSNPLNEHDSSNRSGNENRLIQALSKRAKAMQQRAKRAESKLPPRASITLTQEGNLSVQKSISSNGVQFFNTDTVKLGEIAKDLQPILSQVINLTRAAALGVDYRKRSVMHEEDPETGEVTRKPKLDQNLRPYRMPNQIDRLNAISDVLLENESARTALKTLSQCLVESADLIYNRAIELAQNSYKSDPPEKKPKGFSR